MNRVFVIGNLTKDPETRTTGSGVSVCNFTIAVNRRFKNANGETETDYLHIVAWRQLGDLCGRYLAKGRKAAVTGSIQTRQYDTKDGTKRTAWDIVADEVEFLTPQNHYGGTDSFGAPTGEPQSGYTEAVSKGSGGADYAQKPHNDYGGFTEVDDDELPF